MFFRHGIARTSLEKFAAEACVTRGAIYWHFENRVALFFALREQTILPLVDCIDDALLAWRQEDPVAGIARALAAIFKALDRDEAAREVFQIMLLRCEYVGKFAEVVAEFEKSQNALIAKLTLAYRRARAKGLLRFDVKSSALALDSALFLSGQIRRHLSCTATVTNRKAVLRAIRAHVDLRRAWR